MNVTIVIGRGGLAVEVAGVPMMGTPAVKIEREVRAIPDCERPDDPRWARYEPGEAYVEIRLPLSAVAVVDRRAG